MSEERLFREDKAADAIGISKAVIRTLRASLREGEHWRMAKNCVVYTQSGLDALFALSRVEVQKTLPPSSSEETSATVIRHWPSSPLWVEVALADDTHLSVRVRRGTVLRRGVTITIRKNPQGWHMHGRPRGSMRA